MKHTLFLLVAVIMSCQKNKTAPLNFETVFEKSEGNKTATYAETITFYEHLAEVFTEINIETIGETDSGRPLHVVTYNPDNQFDFDLIKETKRVVLINRCYNDVISGSGHWNHKSTSENCFGYHTNLQCRW